MNNTDSLNESVTIVQKHNTYKKSFIKSPLIIHKFSTAGFGEPKKRFGKAVSCGKLVGKSSYNIV